MLKLSNFGQVLDFDWRRLGDSWCCWHGFGYWYCLMVNRQCPIMAPDWCKSFKLVSISWEASPSLTTNTSEKPNWINFVWLCIKNAQVTTFDFRLNLSEAWSINHKWNYFEHFYSSKKTKLSKAKLAFASTPAEINLTWQIIRHFYSSKKNVEATGICFLLE